jgi:hypothetical protein
VIGGIDAFEGAMVGRARRLLGIGDVGAPRVPETGAAETTTPRTTEEPAVTRPPEEGATTGTGRHDDGTTPRPETESQGTTRSSDAETPEAPRALAETGPATPLGEGAVVRKLETGGTITTTPEGRIRVCINPCTELQHLNRSDADIEAAFNNFSGRQVQRRDLVDTLAAFRSEADLPEIQRIIDELVAGGASAARASDFVARVSRIRHVDGVDFDLPSLRAAFDRGDAILDHGPLQSPIFLEDVIGPYEFVAGRLSVGEPNIPRSLSTVFNRIVDFVIVETNGAYRLILGRNHSGLSGGRASVFSAGELILDKQGYVIQMTNRSGHYRPTEDNLRGAVQFLRQAGILSPARAITLSPEPME